MILPGPDVGKAEHVSGPNSLAGGVSDRRSGSIKDPKSPPAKVLNVASAQQPSPNDSSPYDAEAERELFESGEPGAGAGRIGALQMDDGLTQAARAHAAAMAAQQQLSHQFASEPSLAERLAANCTLHLDQRERTFR